MNVANEMIKRLEEGNARFVADKLDGALQDSQRREKLSSGQQPFAIVLSCADSRVVPEFAFDVGLGELFVIRVAGNTANTSSVASIEYAVAHLGCKLLIVLGHESCGAVTAALGGGDNGKNLNHLLGHIKSAKNAGEGAVVNDVVKTHATATCQDLVESSTIIGDAVSKGTLVIKSAYYELGTGKVSFL